VASIDLRARNVLHRRNVRRTDASGSLGEGPRTDRKDDTVTESAQEYIDDMAARRGYVLDYHKVMAAADFPVLQAANHVVSAAYLDERRLSRETKELLFILSLTVMRAPLPQLRSHIQVALDLGVSPEEILEAIEIALPEAGIVAFQHGVEAWQSVVGIRPLEPGTPVHDGKPKAPDADR
jgi:4-carboxymuconolactone decarboxylase